jgi:hypothetical protein
MCFVLLLSSCVLQFLPQDKVVEFARMDQYELLVATEKAIGDASLYETHQTLNQKRELVKEQQNVSGCCFGLRSLTACRPCSSRVFSQAGLRCCLLVGGVCHPELPLYSCTCVRIYAVWLPVRFTACVYIPICVGLVTRLLIAHVEDVQWLAGLTACVCSASD